MASEKEPKEPSFEASLKRLEDIVNKLEEGELDLDKSIALFEEGVAVTKRLQKKLEEAERKIEKLTRASGGELTAAPMEDEGGGGAPF
ncbi:MAG: exodeoxyribonuclease VII small subunit [Nitrospinae bacterium]|nr:exodeoxyribonuclease VII small subunit [Nitrospinota bacterium]